MLMLVGGIHGGWESNTVTLVEALIAHFEANPDQVLPGLSLLLVPALNPDGAALGGTLAGRFNANGVDLNRNWGCEWEATAYFRDDEVDPGSEPFSEPETTALAALINDFRPAAVLFYHSAANGIFGGRCGDESHSGAMVTVLGEATGYEYGADFTSYPVSGTAPTWVDSLGIPAADVELASASATEFERNLRGVLALQCWLVGEAAADLSLCSLNP
jgi:protein MpaA